MSKKSRGGFLIARIHQLGGRIFSKMLKDNDIMEINPSQGRIMFALWENDGISIQELAKKTSLGKSTLTSMLDRLENSGFIERVQSKEDRRVILIRRTDKDKSFQKQYEQVSEQMTRLFYRGFENSEIEEFELCLDRIFNNLQEYESN